MTVPVSPAQSWSYCTSQNNASLVQSKPHNPEVSRRLCSHSPLCTNKRDFGGSMGRRCHHKPCETTHLYYVYDSPFLWKTLSSDHERLLSCLLWALSFNATCTSLPYWSPGALVVGWCLCIASLCSRNIPPAPLSPSPHSCLNRSLKSQIHVYPLPWYSTWYHSDFLLHLFSPFPEMSLHILLTWLPWTWDPQLSNSSPRALRP